MVPFSLPLLETQGDFFLNVQCEKLVELLEEMLTKVYETFYDWVPHRGFTSKTCPHGAFSNSSITV